VRGVREADDDVGTCAAVGGHRGLLVDVFPTDEIDLDLDPGFLGESCGIGAEDFLIGRHEPDRPQHPQTSAFLDGQLRLGNIGGLDVACWSLSLRTGRRQRGGGYAQGQRITAGDVVCHGLLPGFPVPGVDRR